MPTYKFQCDHPFMHPYRPINHHNLLPEAICETICLTHPSRRSQEVILDARCEACIIDEYRASIKLIQAFMQPEELSAIQRWDIKEEDRNGKLETIKEEEHLLTRSGETWHIDGVSGETIGKESSIVTIEQAKMIFLCMEEQQRLERRLEELQALTELVVKETR